MGIGRAEVSHITILGPILTPMKRGTLLPRSGKYGICTDKDNTFLEQTRYHGDWLGRSFAYFHSVPYTTPHETGYVVSTQ